MYEYAKLATLLIRLIGLAIIIVGLIGILYWLIAGVTLKAESPELARQGARTLSAVVFILAGALITLLGKPIGRLIAKDLDDQ